MLQAAARLLATLEAQYTWVMKRKAANPQPPVQVVSAHFLWAMKCQQQVRDRARIRNGAAKPEDFLFLRPEILKGAKIQWPQGPLIDEDQDP